MKQVDAFLPEFDHEIAICRKVLERVPEAKFSWKPHPKSMTFFELSSHLAQIPQWMGVTFHEAKFDFDGPDKSLHQTPQFRSTKELLSFFDQNTSAARMTFQEVSDEELDVPWTLLAGGKEIFTIPRIAVYRSMIMNHLIHHRAQLAVYLRLNDIPVPAMYGPSADERG